VWLLDVPTRVDLRRQVLYFGYYVVSPMLWSHHGWAALCVLWLVAEAIAGWMLAFLFQVKRPAGPCWAQSTIWSLLDVAAAG
jgi:hypothetical protein